MKTNNSKHPVNQYIIDAISSEGYNSKEAITTEEKLRFALNAFQSEYGWLIARKGKTAAFAEWLSGLPTCFNIAFSNYDILQLALKWGSIQENDRKSRKNMILNNWFDFIAVKFFQLCNRNKVY